MPEDFVPLDLLYLYKEDVLSILNRHGLGHPRVRGTAARGAKLPVSVPLEILVDVLDPSDWAAADLEGVADEIARVIEHEAIVVHCPPGEERLLPGEQMLRL